MNENKYQYSKSEENYEDLLNEMGKIDKLCLNQIKMKKIVQRKY